MPLHDTLQWVKIRAGVRMDLYADDVLSSWYNGVYTFSSYCGVDCFEWRVSSSRLWGLSTTEAINAIVDAFRQKFGKVGL